MPDYRFIFEAAGGSTVPAISDTPTGLQTDTPVDASSGGGAAEGAIKRLESYATTKVLSPLNSATGGLAMPAFKLGKSIAAGASAGMIAGAGVTLVLAAVQVGINKINEVTEKHKAEAAALNERDNLLLRAGSKNIATHYSGSFKRVNSTDRS